MTVRELFGDDGALVAGGLRGYRSWGGGALVPGRLSSVGVSHQWRAKPWERPEVAKCLGGTCDGRSPSRRCTCGIYGWYDPDDQRLVPGALFGAVEATGRVILGSHGFRAEKVRVLGVTSIYDRLRELAGEHGYPVYDSRAELLEAFEPDDVSGLVRHVCTGPNCALDTLHSDRLTRLGDQALDGLTKAATVAATGMSLAVRIGRVLLRGPGPG